MSYNLTKQDIIELMLVPAFNSGVLLVYDLYVQQTEMTKARYDALMMFSSTLATSIIDKMVT